MIVILRRLPAIALLGCLNKGQGIFSMIFSSMLLGFLLFNPLTSSAQAPSYKVLLVGNSNYANFPKLRTPLKDVDAMYQVLISLGIEKANITIAKDLTSSSFQKTVHEFVNQVSADDAVLFYFSGHGFSIDGDDYLAPVDLALTTKEVATRSSIRVETLANSYLATIGSRVIVLDACRTEPHSLKQLEHGGPGITVGSMISSWSAGSLIAYSTSARQASDALSSSGLSLYTQYLVNSLSGRPKDMVTALSNAKTATTLASGGRQVPAVYDEMKGSFVFPDEKLSPRLSHHSPVGNRLVETSVFVIPNRPWTPTGLTVTAGARIEIAATGQINYNTNNTCPSPELCTVGPDGSTPGVPCTGQPVVDPTAPCNSLIGKIGANGATFFVGAHFSTSSAPTSGDLYLGVNDGYFGDNTLGWTATVRLFASAHE